MKKKLMVVMLVLSVILCMGITARASTVRYSGDCGTLVSNVRYELHRDNGWLEITGEGEMKNDPPWRYFKSEIKSVSIGVGVTNISDGAFGECENLAYVSIGESVKTIGSGAFNGCTGLESITIPYNVTKLSVLAFKGCTNLTDINISDNNPNYAERNGIIFSKDLKSLHIYPDAMKAKIYTVPEGVTAIGDYAFSGCENIEKVILPESVTGIYMGAFASCKNLKSINIPNSVNLISSDAFYGCSKLEHINIPSSVTKIWNYTFKNCESLKSISISKSVTSIGYEAFYGCTSLTDVYYEGSEYEWNDISVIADGNGNGILSSATIHYSQPNKLTLSDIEVTEEGSNIYSYTFKMRSPIAVGGIFVFAFYKDGKLVGCRTQISDTPTMEYNMSGWPMEVDDTPTEYKLFFWNDFSDLQPHCAAVEGSISTEEDDDIGVIIPWW